MARKKIDIDYSQVEKLAAIGLNQRQIADSIGISEDTICRRKRDSADFANAYNRGAAKGVAKVCNSLFESATNGNVSAQSIFLKNRAGWSDKLDQNTNHSGEIDHSIEVSFRGSGDS